MFASIASRIGNGDVRSVFEVMNQTADAPALPAGPNAHSRLRPTGSGSRCRSRWWPTSCARALDPRQGPWRRGRCSSRTRSSARGGPWSLPTTSGSGRPRRTRTSSVRAKRARCSIRSARHMSSRRAAGRRHGRVGHSQGGGAALWTGLPAPTYAPELTIDGVATLAPASNRRPCSRTCPTSLAVPCSPRMSSRGKPRPSRTSPTGSTSARVPRCSSGRWPSEASTTRVFSYRSCPRSRWTSRSAKATPTAARCRTAGPGHPLRAYSGAGPRRARRCRRPGDSCRPGRVRPRPLRRGLRRRRPHVRGARRCPAGRG